MINLKQKETNQIKACTHTSLCIANETINKAKRQMKDGKIYTKQISEKRLIPPKHNEVK